MRDQHFLLPEIILSTYYWRRVANSYESTAVDCFRRARPKALVSITVFILPIACHNDVKTFLFT